MIVVTPRFSWKGMILIWLLITVPALWFHYGKGQILLENEQVRTDVSAAAQAFHAKDYKRAEFFLNAAKARVEERKKDPLLCEIDLRLGLVQLKSGKLFRASETIAQTLKDYPEISAQEESEIRENLAAALYYNAWDLRLRGVIRDRWEPIAQGARQTFRHLAENTSDSSCYLRNLEATARLCRLDLTALQGLTLPEELEQAQDNNGEAEEECNKPGKKKPGDNPNGKKKGRQGDIRDQEEPQKQGGIGAPDLHGS